MHMYLQVIGSISEDDTNALVEDLQTKFDCRVTRAEGCESLNVNRITCVVHDAGDPITGPVADPGWSTNLYMRIARAISDFLPGKYDSLAVLDAKDNNRRVAWSVDSSRAA